MGKHYFEIILTSNDVTDIQDGIGKVFGSREISYSMGVNTFFGPRQTNRPYATPNYRPELYNAQVDYYKNKINSPEKVAHIRKKWKNQVKK